jgi:translation initiation factor IF-2
LPVEKKPTSAGEKRKRKRITKVDIKETAAKTVRGRGKPGARKEVTEKDIQKEIKDTLARLSRGKGKKKTSAKDRKAQRDKSAIRAEKEHLQELAAAHTLELTEFVSASELASMMDISVNEVISACMSLGMMVSINQRLDKETIGIIAEEFNFIVDFVSAGVQEAIVVEEDNLEDMETRPPIVTVMGHVDHGKTSLLDFVRNANVISGEAGGITQHIGTYSVELKGGKKMTFIDTPGHEAFTAMRARGAQVTDLAIIVIAADDAVMPQTKEAISHAQAAEIPFIVALNKCDRDTANPDKIKQELSEMNILLEDWGGKIQGQEISAKTGEGVEELLEKVMLEAEMLDLKANPNKRAIGNIVESSLDKGRGYVTSILVSAGTLRVGDVFLAGQWSGKIRAMHDEHGQPMLEAGPSVPVSILGLNGAPNAGDEFHVMEDEREARGVATKRQQLQREQGIRTQRQLTLEELGRRIAVGEFKELNLIIKADVDGSTEALSDTLLKLSTEKVQVNVIHKGVGQISESDVLLASASEAIIIGFQVRPSGGARKLAERENIQIRLYSIIYQAIEEMKDAMEGLLSAKIEERVTGSALIQEIYKISKVGTIAGCLVQDGLIKRSNTVRLVRDGIVVYSGKLGSLKRFKDDAKEVKKGIECGLNIDRFNDIKVGDIIEAYEEYEVKQKL